MNIGRVQPADAFQGAQAVAAGGRVSRRLRVWSARLWSDKLALAAVAVIGAILVLALVGPLFMADDPSRVSLADRLIGPIWTKGGAWSHPFGTDALGRDELAQLMRGARISLLIGGVVVLVAGLFGCTLGLTAGYFGGWYENVVMRLTEAWIAFPGLLLALLILLLVGPGLTTLIVVISGATWMAYTRVAHDTTLVVRGSLYVRAAESLGCTSLRVLTRHVLPNVISPFLTIAVFEFANVVLTEASLSYLGFGIQPPGVSWGLMIASGQEYLRTASWLVVIPGTAIAVLVLALNVLGNWARRAFDPRQQAALGRRRRPLRTQARSRRRGGMQGRHERAAETGDQALLSVANLVVQFPAKTAAPVAAVRGVDLSVARGEVLGLVGESGAGKSVTALALAGLVPAPGDAQMSELRWHGKELSASGGLRTVVGKGISMVFQDPAASLDPLMPIGRQIGEVLELHTGLDRRGARRRATELLDLVGIAAPERRLEQLPHELSGGMLQRVAIAIALAPEPELIIADEPTTALDVTTQAQILRLFQEIQRETGVALLLVAHDLGVVAEMCDRVAVMYAGKIVEEGNVYAIFRSPAHPYTRGLIGSTPRLDAPRGLSPIMGGPASGQISSVGCAFAARCPHATDVCLSTGPELARTGDTYSACWHPRAQIEVRA